MLKHTYFLGKQNDVSAFYQLSDLVLLLSEKESFGLTLLEAMKTGVLPIGSHAGGIKEVIRHEETGFIVDIGIVHKLQNMLLNFYQIQSYIKNAITNAERY